MSADPRSLIAARERSVLVFSGNELGYMATKAEEHIARDGIAKGTLTGSSFFMTKAAALVALLAVNVALAFESSEIRLLDDEYDKRGGAGFFGFADDVPIAIERRDGRLQNPLIRFGKRDADVEDDFPRTIRNDISLDPLIRFGKRSTLNTPLIRFGKRPDTMPLIRFGKRTPSTAPLIRFGKRDIEQEESLLGSSF
uniref:FMRFamide-related neuropeptide n=1 Tax=Steinernema glaseri TaxID=37863 RepID=A0A1I8AGM7_9BILA